MSKKCTRSKTPTGVMFPLCVGRDEKRSTTNNRVTLRIDSKGYPVFKSGFYRDCRVHRVVARHIKGRKLRRDEDVHHRDRRKINFDVENLQILGKAKHGWVSALQRYYMTYIRADEERKQWDEYFATSGD